MKSRATPASEGLYIEFQTAVLKQLPRREDLGQLMAHGWTRNQNSLKKVLAEALLQGRESKPTIDDRFALINTFKITVPANYDHATKLASFSRKNKGKFAYYNDDITDQNFSRATTILRPGRKFEVKIFQIKATVSSMDCLAFLRGEKAVLVGAQGLALAWDEAKDEFHRGRWTVSFDEEIALFKDAGGNRRVPGVRRYRAAAGGSASALSGMTGLATVAFFASANCPC